MPANVEANGQTNDRSIRPLQADCIEHVTGAGCGIDSFSDFNSDKPVSELWNTRTADSDTTLIGELVEASENILIAIGMGWDLEGVINRLTTALTRARKRAGGA